MIQLKKSRGFPQENLYIILTSDHRESFSKEVVVVVVRQGGAGGGGEKKIKPKISKEMGV